VGEGSLALATFHEVFCEIFKWELVSMDQSCIQPRFYADTFGGREYGLDVEENLGYRTPFLDVDSKKADTIFNSILDGHILEKKGQLEED